MNARNSGRKSLWNLTNLAFFIAGIVNLVMGTWAVLQENSSVAAIGLVAGVVLLFAATIDRFESLKGLGIEAKTRQLDQKIDQADDALRRLREMTEITGAALVDLNSKIGRWSSSPTARESIALASRVRQIMESLGSDERAIAIALRPWAKTLCFDMACAQVAELKQRLADRLNALGADQRKIKLPISVDDVQYTTLSAQMRSIHEFCQRLSNFHRLELEDYPNKFMEVFDAVPEMEPSVVESMRQSAERFVPGMQALRLHLSLPDSELWIAELNKARERNT